jgi:hypothetical protein
MSEKSHHIFKESDVDEMFNTAFLPKLQEFAKRSLEHRESEEEVKFFHVNLMLQFSELDEPLTYQMINDRVKLTMHPVTQTDLDRSNENTEENS